MFTSTMMFVKMTVIAVTTVFLLSEASRRRDRRALWMGLALVLFIIKDAVLLYLLQRPPAAGVPVLGEFFNNLVSYGLPLGLNVPLPVEVFHHYFLVWAGAEMLFAVVLQQALSSLALEGRDRLVQLLVLLGNFIIVVIFGILAFTITEYQQFSDMMTYYLWAVVWAGVQYIVILGRTMLAKHGDGLSLNFCVRYRVFLVSVAVFSIVQVATIILIPLRAFETIPFSVYAILWHLTGFLWILVAWLYQRHSLSNADLEAEGRLLQQKLYREMGFSVAETLSMQTIVEMLAKNGQEILDAETCGLFLVDEQGERVSVGSLTGFFPPVEPVKIEENTTPEMLMSRFRANRFRVGKTWVGEVAASGQPLEVLDNLKTSRIPQTGGKWCTVRSGYAIPLIAKKKVYGVLVAVNSRTGKGFGTRQKRLAGLLVSEGGPVLRQLHLYQRVLAMKQAEREFSIALDIQHKLMPQTFPEREGVQISAFSRIAKEGGGDYYDLLDFGEGRFGFVCADIAGKGVAASLVMVIIRSIIRSNAIPGRDASDVVSIVNNTVSSEVGEERFASLYYYQFDTRFRTINYCNAGHTPLMLYRADHGSFARLDTDGMPIGIEKDVEYGQASSSLQPGDIAVLFTDGVVEAMNADLEQFGIERLQHCIRENNVLSARELTDKIYEAMNSFVGGAEQHDDATLLLMKVV